MADKIHAMFVHSCMFVHVLLYKVLHLTVCSGFYDICVVGMVLSQQVSLDNTNHIFFHCFQDSIAFLAYIIFTHYMPWT